MDRNNPINRFQPAEGKYFEMFAAGKNVTVGELRVEMDLIVIHEAESREYTGSEDHETDAGGELARV